MIERAAVGNFKAIGERVEVDLAPLTLFVGTNGVGKSSLLEAMALLAQSVRPPRQFGLVTEGPLVSLGKDEASVYHQPLQDRWLELELTVRLDSGSPIAAWWRQKGRAGYTDFDWCQGLRESQNQRAIQVGMERAGDNSFRVIGQMTSAGAERSWRFEVPATLTSGRFLDAAIFHATGESAKDPEIAAELARWRTLADELAACLASGRLRYSSPLRGAVLMSREATGSASAAGRYGEDTVRLLSQVQAKGTAAARKRINQLAARFGMPSFTAGYGGEGLLEAGFDDPFTGVRISIDHAGFGSQQALPIIGELASAPDGSTIFVEEIEHSTHPEWIAAWAETLAATITDGRQLQVIATSHAPQLVMALALSVQRRILSPEQLAIYEFERRPDGSTIANRRPVDAHGRFEEGWIHSFANAEVSLFKAMLDDDDAGSGSAGGSR